MAYYVPSNNYPLENIPFEKLTHIIFSFTEVIDNQMKFKNKNSSQKLKDLVAYKKQYPHLKVMIACGGWGGCAGFSDMANDPKLRQGFVKSTMDFITEYNLDGTDMDWEYPGMRGAGNTYRKEDTQNFTALMKELRAGLDATADSEGNKRTIAKIDATAAKMYLWGFGNVSNNCFITHISK